MELSGKTALITGASSGLGAHFASVLAAAHANLILAARRLEPLEKVAAEIKSKSLGTVITVRMDVTDSTSVTAGFATMPDVDILVNNAGLVRSTGVLDQSEESWDEVIDTNLKGAFMVAQAAAKLMRVAGKGGSIINVAFILGIRQAGAVLPYAVSKAGVIQMIALGKRGERGSEYESVRLSIETRLVQVQSGQSRSGQTGSECCHAVGRLTGAKRTQ